MSDAMTSDDTLYLPSGRKVYANGGIIGISAEGEIFYGYDGSPDLIPEGYQNSEEDFQDRHALGRLMIARWTAWMNQ